MIVNLRRHRIQEGETMSPNSVYAEAYAQAKSADAVDCEAAEFAADAANAFAGALGAHENEYNREY